MSTTIPLLLLQTSLIKSVIFAKAGFIVAAPLLACWKDRHLLEDVNLRGFFAKAFLRYELIYP